MSGRSCSGACADFFESPAVPAKSIAQGAHVMHIECSASGRSTISFSMMFVDAQPAPPSLWPRRRPAYLCSCNPADRTRNPHAEPGRRLTAGAPSSAALETRNRKSSPSALAIIPKQIRASSHVTIDSLITGRTLEPECIAELD